MTVTRSSTISPDAFLALAGEEAEALIAARYHALRDGGLDDEAAVAIAATPNISVGKAVDLFRRGVDADTVLRLLLSRERPDA